MEIITMLEDRLAKWYGSMEHLPKGGQKWLGRNVWWIVLIGAIVGTLSIAGVLLLAFAAGGLLTVFGGVVGALIAGPLMVAVLISVAVSLVGVVLLFMAISPLKERQKRGWKLLFVALLLSVLADVLSLIWEFTIFGLIWSAIWATVAGYFLFEVRSEFDTKK